MQIGFAPCTHSNDFENGEKIVVFHVFENSASSFCLDEYDIAEFMLWANGLVQERYRGSIAIRQKQKLLQMLKDLPPLDRETLHPETKRYDEEAVFEPDEFTICTTKNCVSNHLRKTPAETYGIFLDVIKEIGKSLPPVQIDSLYILSYPVDPSKYQMDEVHRITKKYLENMPALKKAVTFPYVPVPIEDISELEKAPVKDMNTYYISMDLQNVYVVEYIEGRILHNPDEK